MLCGLWLGLLRLPASHDIAVPRASPRPLGRKFGGRSVNVKTGFNAIYVSASATPSYLGILRWMWRTVSGFPISGCGQHFRGRGRCFYHGSWAFPCRFMWRSSMCNLQALSSRTEAGRVHCESTVHGTDRVWKHFFFLWFGRCETWCHFSRHHFGKVDRTSSSRFKLKILDSIHPYRRLALPGIHLSGSCQGCVRVVETSSCLSCRSCLCVCIPEGIVESRSERSPLEL